MTPKQILLALPLLCLAATANCQHTTLSVGVNSGFFRYTGDHAFDYSGIVVAPYLQTTLEGTPGSKSGFSYEISLSTQRITQSRFLFGAELAWQSLQSQTTITKKLPSLYSSALFDASGQTKLTSQFICLTPFAGYRLLDKKIKIDISTGLEITGCVSRKEKIEATESISQEGMSATNDLSKRPDHRVRLQLNASAGRLGFTTGYAAGITDYYAKDVRLTARSRFIRLGLSYRLH